MYDVKEELLTIERLFLFDWYFRKISLLKLLPISGLMVRNYTSDIQMEAVRTWIYQATEYSLAEFNIILDIIEVNITIVT